MEDTACVEFLQWAAPRLDMRWQGFRRVRKQVCKRIQRRITLLQLEDVSAYRGYLGVTPSEWGVLDGLVRVVVTRFYRDRAVFDCLYQRLLPQRINDIRAGGGERLRAWCIGCASGEEPYTLSLLWNHLSAAQRRGMELEILATDSDDRLLQRAMTACYPYGSIKALPVGWQEQGFERRAGDYCLRDEYKTPVRFQLHDVRQAFVHGPFDLLFCRNLAFTYFNDSLQMETLKKIHAVLAEDGLLVVGGRETLPAGQDYFEQHPECRGIYIRRSGINTTIKLK